MISIATQLLILIQPINNNLQNQLRHVKLILEDLQSKLNEQSHKRYKNEKFLLIYLL
jgi:hypothetical protein